MLYVASPEMRSDTCLSDQEMISDVTALRKAASTVMARLNLFFLNNSLTKGRRSALISCFVMFRTSSYALQPACSIHAA